MPKRTIIALMMNRVNGHVTGRLAGCFMAHVIKPSRDGDRSQGLTLQCDHRGLSTGSWIAIKIFRATAG